MTPLDWILLLIGVPAFFYAFAPTCMRFWERTPQTADSPTATSQQEPAVSPEQSSPEWEREAWEIPGSTTQIFKLYEAACYLAGVPPKWPLPFEAREEYDLLLRAFENEKLDHLDPVEHDAPSYSFAAGFDEHRLKLDRRALLEYLRLEGRPIPEFLEEKFDNGGEE